MPTTSSPVRDVEVARLSNGIRIVTEKMPHVRSVAVGVWVTTGSRAEHPKEIGISHFLEHMLFKGTHTRTAEGIAREVDSIGGNLDAFTGKELVGFNIKVLDEHLPVAMDILADLVLHPRFDPTDLEKEKGVILEELKMELDNPEYVVHELFTTRFWPNHPLSKSILGSRKTIKSFTPAQLAEYHSTIYVPSNLMITAAGNLDHNQLIELAERHFAGVNGELPPLPDPPAVTGAEVTTKKKRLQQALICVGVPALPIAHPRRYAWFVLNTLMGAGMSSRLFQNIRERQGLAYSVFSELNLYRDTGCFGVYAGTAAATVDKVIASVIDEFRQLKANGIPAEELRRSKDHMKGSLMLSLESTGSRMSNLARQFMYFDKFHSLDDMIHLTESVTEDEVLAVANDSFRPENLAITVLGPLDGVVADRQLLA
jgi:predicted Zn-dependent peptidase